MLLAKQTNRRVVFAAVVLLGAATVVTGCAFITPGRFLPPDVPNLLAAHGCLDSDVLVLHRVECVSWLKGERQVTVESMSTVGAIEHEQWSLEVAAPEAFTQPTRAWYASEAASLRDEFDRMVDFLNAAYPNNGGRRLRLVILPPDARFNGWWADSGASGAGLEMTFAFHLPKPGSDVHDESSVGGILATFAHEFSHTYFYFHTSAYRNRYSDEITAYTTERCLRHELFGTSLEEEPVAPDDIARASERMNAHQLLDQFGAKYPDTLIALFASGEEAKRALGDRTLDPESVKRYCTSNPQAGRDFARADTASLDRH